VVLITWSPRVGRVPFVDSVHYSVSVDAVH
jgi:hypothetical protein